MIQIALNGNRKEEFVPVTTEEIVESAVLAVKQGASSIHFHPRGSNGNETLKADAVGAQVTAIREKLNNIPIGVTTGAWIEPDLEKRLQQIKSWKVLPDFVSINFDEFGAERVTEIVAKKGIKVEAGINGMEAAKNFVSSSLKAEFLRVLIEPQEQTIEASLLTVGQIEKYINDARVKIPFLLHGVDKTCWDLVKIAFERNYQTRIGFEDVLTLPNGERAKTNKDLLEQAQLIKRQLLIS